MDTHRKMGVQDGDFRRGHPPSGGFRMGDFRRGHPPSRWDTHRLRGDFRMGHPPLCRKTATLCRGTASCCAHLHCNAGIERLRPARKNAGPNRLARLQQLNIRENGKMGIAGYAPTRSDGAIRWDIHSCVVRFRRGHPPSAPRNLVSAAPGRDSYRAQAARLARRVEEQEDSDGVSGARNAVKTVPAA